MKAKEYLQQIQKCDKRIENRLSMLKMLRDLATSVTSVMKDTPVQGGGANDKIGNANDKIGNAIVNIISLENEINAEVDKFVDLKREAMRAIDKIDPPYSCILYKRYFEYQTWEQIAVDMNFCFRHTVRLHGIALKMLDGVLAKGNEDENVD